MYMSIKDVSEATIPSGFYELPLEYLKNIILLLDKYFRCGGPEYEIQSMCSAFKALLNLEKYGRLYFSQHDMDAYARQHRIYVVDEIRKKIRDMSSSLSHSDSIPDEKDELLLEISNYLDELVK